MFAQSDGASASVKDITHVFNIEHAAEYGHTFTNKSIGYILRSQLGLQTQKSGGVYVIPVSARAKLEAVAQRYGLASDAEVPPAD